MSDIVERLRQNAGPSGEWGELADRLQIEAADEIERLRIRCDGYQASQDWAINRLAATLHVEADTVRAVEFYARLAAEEIERLRAELASMKVAAESAIEYVAEREREECEQVRDEIERLRAEYEDEIDLKRAALNGTSKLMGAEIERLRAENAELRADADRLVWLIESIRGADLYRICYPHLTNPGTVGNVIAAIDAARAALGESK